MFGAPNTTAPPGFNFGAGTTAASGGGATSAGFSFGAPSGGSTGGGTTGGFGGFGLSSGGTAATTAGTSTGFNFGLAATKAATGTTGGFSGFNFGAPQQTQASSTPSTGFGFGATASTTNASTTGGLILGGGASAGTAGFGLRPAAPATTTAPPATGGFSGFGTPASSASGTGAPMLSGLLSSTTSSAPTLAAAAAAPASTTASTGFSLSTPSFGTTSTGATSFGTFPSTSFTTPAQSTTASTGFSFKPTPAQSTATTSASGLPGFGTSSVSTAVTSTTTGAAAVSFPGATGQKQMTFRQLEDTINKWTTELEEQERYFLDQATQVNAWDRIVMENGEKIIQLNKDVEKVKLDQQKLDHELDFVHSQQRELEALLTPLEKALDSMPPISYQQHADVERENTYMLAESLDAQLKHMGQDLKEIIERLNTTNSAPDPNDPVQQITKILNAHVVSLMWVDRNSANLQRRVEEISRQMDIEKREQERNFRLAYS